MQKQLVAQQYGRVDIAGWLVLLLILGGISAQAMASESGLEVLNAEEVAEYAFEIEETETKVSELSIAQNYVLRTWRQKIAELAARQLGVVQLRGDRRDLLTLQMLVDKKFIKPGDVQTWQGMGMVFGDLLVKEFALHWVSYQDDLGISKALRYKKTDNYIFPVTLFSKRVEFNENVDLLKIFDNLAANIATIKAREDARIRFKSP